MQIKFKSTATLPKALLYKRFIGLEKSINLTTVYKTVSDGKVWTFDNETLVFSQINSAVVTTASKITEVEDFTTVLQYQNVYFKYTGLQWDKFTQAESTITPLSATFNNIGRYQTNKYYYVGAFDFMIKGSIEGTNTQYIKGNILPLTAFNIKHFNDSIKLTQDDLVVVEKRLYSVENPETDIKYNPKPYKIYFATLNSIL